MEKKYYLRENGQNIAYSYEELLTKQLNRKTKVWIEGATQWQPLYLIPELNEVSNMVDHKPKKTIFWAIISAVVVIIASIFIFNNYKKNKAIELEKEAKKLVEISPEKLYNKYESAVVLIKHSFLYSIKVGDSTYYFKSFDKNTGEIEDLKGLNELKSTPNVSWGTGFMINKNGAILTNRHVVRVNPTKEEQQKILDNLKYKSYNNVMLYDRKIVDIRERLSSIENQLNYSYLLSEYELSQLQNDKRLLLENLQFYNQEKTLYSNITALTLLPDNFVSKTSTEFGVFFNKERNTDDYKNYIKYKSSDISNDQNIDLAIINPINQAEISKKRFNIVDLSLLDSLNFKPRKINDKVRMIAFNSGANLAQTTEGINSQLTEGNISQVNDVNRILYTIPSLPGSSGAPVFDKYGRLVAVNFAGLTGTQSFNYGIQTKKVQEYLQRNRIINPK